MRKIALCLVVLVLAYSASAQSAPPGDTGTPPGDFDFSGASLRVSVDSMSDRQVCTVSTENWNGAWVATTGPSTAMISTMWNLAVDYREPAFLRIGDSAPIKLVVSPKPHALYIPPEKMAAVVRALYAQERIRLRFTEWPGGGLFDDELRVGDFAAAYDRGVELCHWPRIAIAAVHPPKPTQATAENPPVPETDFQRIYPWYVGEVGRLVARNFAALAAAGGPALAARCALSFTVRKDGFVRDVGVVQSSGDAATDKACLAAGRASNPMPPLPRDYAGSALTLRLNLPLVP